jgi:hypothetical protein
MLVISRLIEAVIGFISDPSASWSFQSGSGDSPLLSGLGPEAGRLRHFFVARDWVSKEPGTAVLCAR